jgi:hypothetical protein
VLSLNGSFSRCLLHGFRQRAVPFVSRRWRQLARFPTLLTTVDISLQPNPVQLLLPHLQSLCSWLTSCAASYVVRLRIKLHCDVSKLSERSQQAAAQLLTALAHYCAAGQLQVLVLETPHMTNLGNRLVVHIPNLWRVGSRNIVLSSASGPPHGDRQLGWLELSDHADIMWPRAHLPSMLTRLTLNRGQLRLSAKPPSHR